METYLCCDTCNVVESWESKLPDRDAVRDYHLARGHEVSIECDESEGHSSARPIASGEWPDLGLPAPRYIGEVRGRVSVCPLLKKAPVHGELCDVCEHAKGYHDVAYGRVLFGHMVLCGYDDGSG